MTHDPALRRVVTPPRVLIIRRDNIGDLVCTLPIFEGIRQHYPQAYLGALVNSYNAPLLQDNPFLNRVHVYTKSKHQPTASVLSLVRERLMLVAGLHKERYQIAFHAGSRPRQEMRTLAWLAGISDQVLDQADARPIHEVSRVYRLLRVLNISGPPPAPKIPISSQSLTDTRGFFASQGFENAVGLHISAREDENRWPLEHFVFLIQKGTEQGLKFVLFWSPGDADRPEHPGDDGRAQDVLDQCRGLPVIGYPTADLLALGAGLASVRILIGSDGGHIHMAAAVGTSVIGLYCHHKVARWRPWGAGHTVLHAKRVADIPVDAVLASLTRTVRS